MTHAKTRPLRLRIEPVVARAEQHAAAVQQNLPGHEGLLGAARGVAAAAHQAERISRQLQRTFGPHRLPALFLAMAMLLFAGWTYWYFLHVSRLTVALPDRDAIALRDSIARRKRVLFEPVEVRGSREAAELVTRGEVDLAFVQGGIALPRELQRLQTPRPELVLLFLRPGSTGIGGMRRMLTSLEEEGSHSVARDFVSAWGLEQPVAYVHDWTRLADDASYQIADDIDAVLVVKDPGDEATLRAAKRLAAAGFRLVEPSLGARGEKLDYLKQVEIPAGYLQVDPATPTEPVATYSVATYLVARPGLTPRMLGMAAGLLEGRTASIADAAFEPDMAATSDVLQGIEAFIGILAYIGLAFLALLGVEVMTYRRRFNELDSLVSLISMYQSDKDVLGVRDGKRRSAHLLYLSTCSDLLGLISVIAGYYSQENASLLYNNLLGIVHDRSSSLKLNIQLKILHASLDIGPPPSAETLAELPAAPLPSVAPAEATR
jgi:hypothetical protein